VLTKKKKISRKEIKEDKLVTTYYQAVGYFNENKSRIYIYTGIVVGVVALVFFYLNYKHQNNLKASAELGKVMDLYENGAYQEAIDGRAAGNVKGLKAIVDEYGSTETGEIAKVYLANAYNFLGKTEEAFEYYDDYSGDNKLFKASALAGEASYYASKGEFVKAANTYKEAAYTDKSNPMNPDYLLKAGINFLNADEKENASEVFETIKEEFKTTTAAREVDKYMAVLK